MKCCACWTIWDGSKNKMFQVLFSDNPRTDTIVKRWVGIGALVAMMLSVLAWVSNITDPMIATEYEVMEIDQKSMDEQMPWLIPYPMR